MAESSKNALHESSVGEVFATIDRNTFTIAINQGMTPSYNGFVEVLFQRQGVDYVLLGQIERIVGEGVVIGQITSSRISPSTPSFLGGVRFVQPTRIPTIEFERKSIEYARTEDIHETQVRATARIIGFINLKNLTVTTYDPTIEYMGKEVHEASKEHLRIVFSQIEAQELVPLEVGTLQGVSENITVALDPSGLMRHTAVFGQSGSGKSFILV
jgi:uncharacterized protein DUF87